MLKTMKVLLILLTAKIIWQTILRIMKKHIRRHMRVASMLLTPRLILKTMKVNLIQLTQKHIPEVGLVHMIKIT